MKSRLISFLFFLVLCLSFHVDVDAKPSKNTQSSGKETITYVVKKGDSVDKISKKYQVTTDDIVRWNHLSDASHIRVGQKLKIRVSKEIAKSDSKSNAKSSAKSDKTKSSSQDVQYTYVVKKGDSLSKISKKTGVSIEDLKKHNPSVRKAPNKLKTGQTLVLRERKFNGATGSSHGLANSGYLVDGIELKSGAGYVLRKKNSNFGTSLSVGLLMDAFEAYATRYPKGPRFAIGDLSLKKGGRFAPHLSHQSGRDVDISYVDKNNKEFVGFQKMNASNFDVAKNWFVIEYFLKSKKVQYIFVDYDLQKLLYEHALKHGYTATQLRTLIEYPNGIGSRMAIVRHSKGHADHMHVRFICAPTDKDCR